MPLSKTFADANQRAMKHTRRILVIQTQAENAGAQEISRLAGAGLKARGFDVQHLFFYRKSQHFDEPPHTLYCAKQRPASATDLLRLLWTLARHIRRERWEAILTFQHYGNVVGGAVARLLSRAPVIANQVSSRLTMNWPVRTADKIMGSVGCFAFITVNTVEMQREYSRYPHAYRRRLRYVAHGFERKLPGAAKRDARRRFALPGDGVLLGSVSRLHPLKRLDAAIRLLPRRQHWHLALAGQGPDEPRLRQLAARLEVSGRIHFVGEISPDAIGDFLAGLDVFVFPSAAETFGLAAVEAANAGIPTVVTDLPVLREVLSCAGEPAAFFVDTADDEKFLSMVSSVLADPAATGQVLRTAKGLAQRYCLDAMNDQFAAIIDDAVRDRRPARALSSSHDR
jgi:glycosyltransferase involved in cell wall biosynthesis